MVDCGTALCSYRWGYGLTGVLFIQLWFPQGSPRRPGEDKHRPWMYNKNTDPERQDQLKKTVANH
ncbi:hypothetical protein NQZ68_013645 [Dissostichus eleginoides]|nr:hypothetical protein NQZ68_013645 [Dissostichus eleginoides]